ncbi:hypothetical protein BgiMline_014286 [Biomphalaria glabrata]|uniref:Uncharacterized protein LOC106053996 isoform X1 n=1 Tax=Biomphalaria glabrata TaxID=6526 RepID=A0A9U8DY28_BIOGL|nr:uncharacterized protein LOC106053996 isoform X1 [Biomphalaria glabrata]XP_013065152.2 uncharacterized protein LOC106053996 isoform X1 [Biomphalaria glabrata]KAI8754586.1 hypothetical protein BgiMline_013052 [Biomphalaria glabrata]KAI8773213.1 hypothetical protein BgiBS90_025631 [Biomphalaria glabrata]
MAGHYSCENVLIQCYDNQAALEDYKCRMKLEEFYMTGANCLNSPEKESMNVSTSREALDQHQPTQGSPVLEGIKMVSLEGDPAPGVGVKNIDQNHSSSPWNRCGYLVRGLLFWKYQGTPLKYRTPLKDATASGTPSLPRW